MAGVATDIVFDCPTAPGVVLGIRTVPVCTARTVSVVVPVAVFSVVVVVLMIARVGMDTPLVIRVVAVLAVGLVVTLLTKLLLVFSSLLRCSLVSKVLRIEMG